MRVSFSLFFMTPFLFTLTACVTPSDQPPTAIEVSTPEHEQAISSPYATELQEHFRGQLFYKNNNAYFRTCEDQANYPVTTKTALSKTYKKISDGTDDPVYIEFIGEINFPKNATSNNPVVMEINHIQHMALTKNSLQCAKAVDTFSFRANGNNPYWRVNMQENTLFLATQVSNQSFTLDASHIATQGSKVLTAGNKKGEKLSLKIDAGDCYADENKEYWGYNTEVTSIDGNYIGCGEMGELMNDRPLEGNYQNKLQQFDEETIQLTLNTDHTAEYVVEDRSKRMTKKGFWKSNQENTLAVMLVSLGDQKIQEEMVFQRKGENLISSGINSLNVMTAFSEPLVLNKMTQKLEQAEPVVQTKRQFTPQLIVPQAQIDTDAQQAVRQYFKIHNTDPKETRFSSVRFDLNGDGREEAIVMLDWCSENGCELLIFEAKDKGLVFSSRISRVQAPITVAHTQHFSWQDLLVSSNQQWLQLNFDGLSYPLQLNQAKSIEGPTDSSGVVLFNQGKPDIWFPIK